MKRAFRAPAYRPEPHDDLGTAGTCPAVPPGTAQSNWYTLKVLTSEVTSLSPSTTHMAEMFR